MAMAKKPNAVGSEICRSAAKKSRVRFGDTPTTSPTCKLSMTKKTCAHTAAVSGLRIRTHTTAAVARRTKNTLRQRLRRHNSFGERTMHVIDGKQVSTATGLASELELISTVHTINYLHAYCAR